MSTPLESPLPPLLRAAAGLPGDRVPVWFMRQAGRSLPEYFEVRGEGSILQAISDAERATEITMQPVRRYDIDAAILFSDIVTPVWVSGFGIDITPGVGPTCDRPFTSAADLERLRPIDDDDLGFQTDTVRALVDQLPHEVPLIGFAGAPYTLAAYLVEGRPSKDYAKVKAMMFAEPELWHALADRLADYAIATLRNQVANGARAVQLFDSWVGGLRPEHYREFVQPHSAKVLAAMAELDVPRFHFGINTGELLADMADAGAEVVGVDWRTPLSVARERTGGRVGLQGNLDPALLSAPWEVVEPEVRRVLDDNGGHPGHVFNLGHGVTPSANPETIARIAEYVHTHGTAMGDGSTGAAG